jgi:outer membrane lipopolysaccharide assembly protein LptE/RlpB
MNIESKRRFVLATVLLLAVASLTGCGYSLAGRGSSLPPYVRSIGIPLFVNSTPIYELEQQLTQRVRLEFIGRGKYQVVPDATGTDAVLNGEITQVAFQPTAFNAQQQASRYAITVVVKVELKDLKQNKTLYENPGLTFRDEYEVTTGANSGDVGTFLGQNKDALDRLSQDFARSVVSTILEAF